MPNGPVVTKETWKRQREACDKFTQEIDDAVEDYLTNLNDIAKKYKRLVFPFSTPSQQMMTLTTSQLPYVLSIAGTTSNTKLSTRHPTAYSVFCGKKLREENNGAFSISSLKTFLLMVFSLRQGERPQNDAS